MEKGNVIFHCGQGYYDVQIKKDMIGQRICIFDNQTNPKRLDNKTGKDISCFDCPCKRLAKRKQVQFWHTSDKDTDGLPQRPPTGVSISCVVAEVEEL